MACVSASPEAAIFQAKAFDQCLVTARRVRAGEVADHGRSPAPHRTLGYTGDHPRGGVTGVPGPKQERQTASPNHSDHVWKPHKQGGPLHTACTLRAAHESVILNPGELLRILVLFMRALCAHCREVEGQLQVRNQLDPTEAHRRRGVHTRALALTHHLCAVPRDSGALTRGSATAPDGASAFRGCFRHAHLLQHSAVTRAQHLCLLPKGR